MTEWKIPLADVDLGPAEAAAVQEVLSSGWLTMGPRTEQFEVEFARRHGVPHAVALASGTAALHLALVGLGIGPGDEVILPALTFVAAANVVVLCGARPVFADILAAAEPTLDPDHVASLITPRTRAISPVHFAGYACRMKDLAALAERQGLAIIEDCAHSPGTGDNVRSLGSWGAAGCFSFFSNKNMTTGEGGMLITHDAALADRVRLLRSHGMTSGTWRRHHERPQGYDVREPGWNYRIDEIRSALGLVQLGKLEGANQRRRALTARYRERLDSNPEVTVAFAGHPGPTAAHLLPLVVGTETARPRVVDALTAAGIQTSHHYPPVHLFEHYQGRFGYRRGLLPRTESFAAREVTLPLHAGLRDDDVDRVAERIGHALHEHRSPAR